MTNPLRPIITCVLALVFSHFACAAAAPFELPKAFKADIEMQMEGQKLAGTLICGGEDKQRVEITSMGMTTIVRKDIQKIYMLMTARKQIMEMPYNPAMAQDALGFANDKDASWEKLGQETIRDIACDKWKVTSAKGETMTCWVKPADHAPVRVIAKGNAQVDFLSFAAGKQDDALFDPPAGWNKLGTPVMDDFKK
jgi:hypothetical protein